MHEIGRNLARIRPRQPLLSTQSFNGLAELCQLKRVLRAVINRQAWQQTTFTLPLKALTGYLNEISRLTQHDTPGGACWSLEGQLLGPMLDVPAVIHHARCIMGPHRHLSRSTAPRPA